MSARARSDAEARFAAAAQALLMTPLLDRTHPAWPDIVVERRELRDWFEELCGWNLHVDARGGVARLYKRRTPDPTRPLRRANNTPMRRDGYAILMLCAAELISRPTTTLGDLADNIAVASTSDSTLPSFDPTQQRDRHHFVDAVRWLADNGLITITAGNLDRFADGEGEAVISADPSRFALLLASTTPPSRIQASTTDEWIAALCEEPRYREAAHGEGDEEAVRRHARHQLGRALLDDPVLHPDRLAPHVQRYLSSGAGRDWVLTRVRRAGFRIEESSDSVVAVDPSGEATDRSFGRSVDTITQVAVVLLAELCPQRRPRSLPVAELEATVDALLAEDPRWAAAYQKPDGAATLTQEALETLVAFGLVELHETEPPDDCEPARAPGGDVPGAAAVVTARPVAARFDLTVLDNRRVGDHATDLDEPGELDAAGISSGEANGDPR